MSAAMNLYLKLPYPLKWIAGNLEGIKRSCDRRGGKYKEYYSQIELSILFGYEEARQIEKLNRLLEYVHNHIPYYQKRDLVRIEKLEDMNFLPILSKYDMRGDISQFINSSKKQNLISGLTSGSTGTPFHYYADKNATRFNYAVYDHMYHHFCEGFRAQKARISGISIGRNCCTRPPFWYYVYPLKQLQLSTYQLNSRTYGLYLEAIKKHKVKWIHGFASAWDILAQNVIENNRCGDVKFSAFFSDAEKLTERHKRNIERAFCCKTYQTYGLSEVAMVALQCESGHFHIFQESCIVEILDEDGRPSKPGEAGEIVVTNLNAFDAPFIRYRTGDLGIKGADGCACGWKTPFLQSIEGRVEDYILKKDGSKLTKLINIPKGGAGIQAAQLIQERPGQLEVRIVPAADFKPESMNIVMSNARYYLGGDMDVSWRAVEALEKTASGKIKYIIRR